MKTIILTLAAIVYGLAGIGAPLDLESLKRIVASDHSDKPLHKELQIYPNARKYLVTVKVVEANGAEHISRFEALEKHVDGRYIVSESNIPGPIGKIIMVVEYDENEQIYRKYILDKTDVLDISVGTRMADSRVISWHVLNVDPKKPVLTLIMLEEHTEELSTWKTVYLRDGKLLMIETGTATPEK